MTTFAAQVAAAVRALEVQEAIFYGACLIAATIGVTSPSLSNFLSELKETTRHLARIADQLRDITSVRRSR